MSGVLVQFVLVQRVQKVNAIFKIYVFAAFGDGDGDDYEVIQQSKVCLTGILVIGGINDDTSQSVEIWSAADPEQGSCVLNDYPRGMGFGPTVNLVSGRLVACYLDTCEIYREGSWQHLQNTTVEREYHSSATTEDAVLLIGSIHDPFGSNSTTEWIPVDGSAAHQGPFTVRHGHSHCSIQISDDIIVVTGGVNTGDYATQYHLTDGTETPLTSFGQGRAGHACGVYQDTSGQHVSKTLMFAQFKSCWFELLHTQDISQNIN